MVERALAIKEKVLGPEHPDVANSLNNIATVYRATGAYEDAKALHERALAIREKALGPKHPEVAMSLHNLANVHRDTGAYEDAKALHERALAMWEETLGPKHPLLAEPLVGLAKIALEQRRAGDALVLARRAVTVREQENIPPVDLADARFVLARALAEVGSSRVEAIALAEQARDVFREAGSEELDEVERWLEAHPKRCQSAAGSLPDRCRSAAVARSGEARKGAPRKGAPQRSISRQDEVGCQVRRRGTGTTRRSSVRAVGRRASRLGGGRARPVRSRARR